MGNRRTSISMYEAASNVEKVRMENLIRLLLEMKRGSTTQNWLLSKTTMTQEIFAAQK